MRRLGRRIGCVGSLVGTRALGSARLAVTRTGGGGDHMGGHCHQRKLFSMPVIRRLFVPEFRRLFCGALAPGSCGALRRIVLPPRLSCPGRRFLLLAPPEISGIAGRLGELPASSFWKDEIIRRFLKNSSYAQGSGSLRSPYRWALRVQISTTCGVTDGRAGRKCIFTMP